MDDHIDEDGIKSLRRNMFICQSERVDHIMKVRMKRMGWNRRRLRLQIAFNDQYDLFDSCDGDDDKPSLDTFSHDCRALSNSDVLEHIVLHLTKTDLFNCRLVCKFWATEMAYFISKRKSLVITDTDEHNPAALELLKKRSEGQPVSVSKLGFFDVGSGCPIFKRLFHVFGWTLSIVYLESCNLSPYDLKQMLFVHAPNIENLHFREQYFGMERPTSYGSILQQVKQLNNGNICLPKMKVLHWDESGGQTELKDFIEACPNLISLEFRNFPLPRSSNYKTLNWDSLRHMFLSPKDILCHEHCKALKFLKLKLKNLTLFGINSRDKKTMMSLSKFLATLSDTLMTLELWLHYEAVFQSQEKPQFSPLTVLLPNVTKLHTESEILGHINNLRKFPSVSELEIVSNRNEQQNWNSLTKRATIAPPCPNLRFFRCGEIDIKSLDKMMTVFPNITSLSIHASHVDDKFLRSIYLNLSQLIDLSISPCLQTHTLPITDSGITGVSADRCAKLRKHPNKWSEEEIQAWKTQPDIGKLQCLQTLDLSFQKSNISDVSVLYGISRLPRLKTLKMPICQVTDASLSVIENKLAQLVLLGISGCKFSSDAVSNFKKNRGSVVLDLDMPGVLRDLHS